MPNVAAFFVSRGSSFRRSTVAVASKWRLLYSPTTPTASSSSITSPAWVGDDDCTEKDDGKAIKGAAAVYPYFSISHVAPPACNHAKIRWHANAWRRSSQTTSTPTVGVGGGGTLRFAQTAAAVIPATEEVSYLFCVFFFSFFLSLTSPLLFNPH